jgi:hypothetical protein
VESGTEAAQRGAERGAHDDLEELIVGVLRAKSRNVVVRHLVRVTMDLVDEGLKLRRGAGPVGGRPSHGGIGFTGAAKHALNGSVAEARVRIDRHGENLGRGIFARNVVVRLLLCARP